MDRVEQYVVQRHVADAAGGAAAARIVLGYFPTLQDAQAALDERFEDGRWQGIRDPGRPAMVVAQQ